MTVLVTVQYLSKCLLLLISISMEDKLLFAWNILCEARIFHFLCGCGDGDNLKHPIKRRRITFKVRDVTCGENKKWTLEEDISKPVRGTHGSTSPQKDKRRQGEDKKTTSSSGTKYDSILLLILSENYCRTIKKKACMSKRTWRIKTK